MKESSKPFFWVTNASPMNVTLADLALNIKAYTTINLLDKKHYDYTLEQLLTSKSSGSLFKKQDKIKVRNIPPEPIKNTILIQKEAIIEYKKRSTFIIKEEHYDELQLSDDDYINENSEISETIKKV